MTLQSLVDVPAPAKLNLFLHIEGKRADGLHLLDSLMVPIDWCDLLHFERRADGALARHDRGAELPADDLCLRASRALQQASGTAWGVDITIDKRVPWGAGLGGGSSDAASTLLALNVLWGLDWPLARLLPIGLALGADVPFFLGGTPARVGGIGEKLAPVPFAATWFAVVKPAAGLATRAVFASPHVAGQVEAARIAGFSGTEGLGNVGVDDRFDGGFDGRLGSGLERELGSELESGLDSDLGHEQSRPGREFAEGFGRNDLQAAAEGLCPDVSAAAAGLQARFGNSRMTGSGSAVFAWAGSGSAGSSPKAEMPGEGPVGWSSRMCRSLERHPLAGWARREV